MAAKPRDGVGDSVPNLGTSGSFPVVNGELHLTVTDGMWADHEAAVRVWRAANVARGLPPTAERVDRIWKKLAESGACLVVGRLGGSGEVLAMALAEPGRAEDGAGTVLPGYGHVSMVFVHPDMWGVGLGRDLLQGLHDRASARGWSHTTLWTRASNSRARRLYQSQGYRASGNESTLGGDDPVVQLQRGVGAPAVGARACGQPHDPV
jgi:GNAT superfamily N-acetyltransferase